MENVIPVLLEYGVLGALTVALLVFSFSQFKSKDVALQREIDRSNELLDKLSREKSERLEDAKAFIPLAHELIEQDKKTMEILEKVSRELPEGVRSLISEKAHDIKERADDIDSKLKKIAREIQADE